jgi:quinol monooxygenase YgiN
MMTLHRRELLALAGAAAVAPLAGRSPSRASLEPEGTMYGLIGKITAVAGQRDALAAVLLEGTRGMPGCLSYVIANDSAEADSLWITEVWESQASHQASLALPGVQAAIAMGRPLIAGFSHRVETVPIGGQGLDRGAPR